MSIALVIIGLLVGGVFVGKELIHVAAIRSQVSQFQSFNSALRTFQLKYNAIPGDMTSQHANAFGLPPSGGNEDGLLRDSTGSMPARYADGEPLYFFVQLHAANLIKERSIIVSNNSVIGEQFPAAVVGKAGMLGYSTSEGKLAYFYGISISYAGMAVTNLGSLTPINIVPSVDAQTIDGKIDDGLPVTGKMRSVTYSTGIVNGNAAGSCYSAGIYLTSPAYSCLLSIDAQ